MKVLITGGAGFVGSNLAEELAKDHEVTILDNFSLGIMENLAAVKDKVKIVKGDVKDEETVKKVCDVDFILHQAAASSSPMFKDDLKGSFSVNIDGFINLLNAARDNNVKRFIFASSSSIYGNIPGLLKEDMGVVPPNFYSITKLTNEHLAKVFSQEYGLETVGFRYMSIYGPHEESKGIYANLVSQFLWAMKKGEPPVIYGDGSQTRDFTYVKDVVKANVLALESKKKFLGEIFNVGTGSTITLNGLIEILNKVLNKDVKPKYVENPIKNYILTQQADLTKAKTMLGYDPKYSLEEGIRDGLSSQCL